MNTLKDNKDLIWTIADSLDKRQLQQARRHLGATINLSERVLEIIESSNDEEDFSFTLGLITHIQMIAELYILFLKAETKRNEKDK